MAGNLATKQEYKAGCDFRRFNGEFQQHIVGWGFYINNKNTVASQNSSGSENLTDPKMVLTPLTTLTTAPQGAETLVLSGFQAHEVCSYIWKPLKKCSQRQLCHPAAAQPEPTKITALRDLKQKFDTS